MGKRQRDLKRSGQRRLQLSTIQKPQFTESLGMVHASGKAAIPGEEVEPRPSISPSGWKGNSQTGLYRQEGFRRMEAGYGLPQQRGKYAICQE